MNSDSDYSGVFEGISPRVFWWPVAAAFIYSPVLLLAMWYAANLRASDDPMLRVVFYPPLGLVYGAIVAFGHWRRHRVFARRITWQDDGLTVTWYDGRSRSFAWNEIDRVDAAYSYGALIKTTGTDDFALSNRAAQYNALLAALQEHV